MLMRRFIPAVALSLCLLTIGACAELQNVLVQDAANRLAKCEFRLRAIRNFTLSNVKLAKVSTPSQFSLQEGLQLGKAFASGSLPAAFTLDVAVKNPNDGNGGLKKAAGTLSAFPWSLYIDDQKTVSGNIANAIDLPAGSQETVIPLDLNLDLMHFFKNQGFKKIVDLALAMGGAQGSAKNLKLTAKPTIDTAIGPIVYPNEIDIVDRTYGESSGEKVGESKSNTRENRPAKH